MQKLRSFSGCEENDFYSLPFGQAEASIYQHRRHFNQPQKRFVLLLFKFLIKHHLPVRQVKNGIHQPDSKIHQPQAIRHYFLSMLILSFFKVKNQLLGTRAFSQTLKTGHPEGMFAHTCRIAGHPSGQNLAGATRLFKSTAVQTLCNICSHCLLFQVLMDMFHPDDVETSVEAEVGINNTFVHCPYKP